MVDLQDVCDLPIQIDDITNSFQMSKCVKCYSKRTISITSISHTLLNRFVNYPQNVYNEYSVSLETDQQLLNDKVNYDLIVIPAGLLGIEFIKSHVYYTPVDPINPGYKYSCIAECIRGNVTLIMQRNDMRAINLSHTNLIKEGIFVQLKPKDKIAIPEGYMYTFVNVGETTSVISRVYKTYSVLKEDLAQKMSGMAYFCIRKNAKQEFVYNPKFKSIPNIKESSPLDNHFPKLGFGKIESLYKIAIQKTETLERILA